MINHFLWVIWGLSIFMVSGCKQDKTEAEEEVDPLTAHYQTFDSLSLTVTNTDVAPSFYLHQSGEGKVSTECSISKSDLDSGGKEILCWLEAEELDLYFNGVIFNLKVPYGSCDYVSYKPFYFFDYQPGDTNIQYSSFTFEGCEKCDYNLLATICPQCEFTIPADDLCSGGVLEASMLFDYTLTEGPNCDEGTASLYSFGFTDGATDTDGNKTPLCSQLGLTQTADTDGTGKYQNCMKGPGKESDYVNEKGWPVGKIYSSIAGLETTFTLASPLSKGFNSNLYLANYLESCAEDDYTYDVSKVLDYSSRLSSNQVWNTAQTNIKKLRDPYKGINPLYIWTCYNKAQEVRGRIYLQIRDWDTPFTLSDDLDKTNPEKMDFDGNEETWGSDDFNDRTDWDDLYSGGTRCSAGGATTTGITFPQDSV